MVYLAIKDDKVIHHTDIKAMREWDKVEPVMQISTAEFFKHDNLARLINGEIHIGYTQEELKEQEKQRHIDQFLSKLEDIDKESGAKRTIRKAAIDMGEMLKAFRKVSLDLGDMLGAIRKVAMDFGEVTRILGEANPELAEEFNPDENIALQTLIEFDPEQNEELKTLALYDPEENVDLNKIKEFEGKAEEIREQLRPLLEGGTNA